MTWDNMHVFKLFFLTNDSTPPNPSIFIEKFLPVLMLTALPASAYVWYRKENKGHCPVNTQHTQYYTPKKGKKNKNGNLQKQPLLLAKERKRMKNVFAYTSLKSLGRTVQRVNNLQDYQVYKFIFTEGYSIYHYLLSA